MTTHRSVHDSPWPIRLGLIGAAALFVAARGSSGGRGDAEPQGLDSRTAETVAVSSPPPPTTTRPDAAPETTEGCGSQCPLSDEQQRAVDAFFEAYNGDDWAAVLATISEHDRMMAAEAVRRRIEAEIGRRG